MKNFIKGLLWGADGRPSLTSTMALTAFVFFILTSVYLVATGTTWAHYEVFAAATCGGGLFTQLGGKYINNK